MLSGFVTSMVKSSGIDELFEKHFESDEEEKPTLTDDAVVFEGFSGKDKEKTDEFI